MPQAYPWPGLVLLPPPHWDKALPVLVTGLPHACCATDAGGNGSALLRLSRMFPSSEGTEDKKAAEAWEDGTSMRESLEGGRVEASVADASPV